MLRTDKLLPIWKTSNAEAHCPIFIIPRHDMDDPQVKLSRMLIPNPEPTPAITLLLMLKLLDSLVKPRSDNPDPILTKVRMLRPLESRSIERNDMLDPTVTCSITLAR
jgi:hypothetical protein